MTALLDLLLPELGARSDGAGSRSVGLLKTRQHGGDPVLHQGGEVARGVMHGETRVRVS